MVNDLVSPADLASLPGAPFTGDEVDIAAAVIRDATGWHIAPERTETVTFDILRRCQARLLLPTRKLVSVSEVRAGGETVDPTAYEVSIGLAQVVKSSGYWPAGYGIVEVDMIHGYESVPLPLLAVIAEAASTNRRDQSVKSEGTGPFTIAFGIGGAALSGNPLGTGATLEQYSLPRAEFV